MEVKWWLWWGWVGGLVVMEVGDWLLGGLFGWLFMCMFV